MLCDPADYGAVADAITTNGGTDLVLRRHLAAKCFARTARTIVRSPAGWLQPWSGLASNDIFARPQDP